MDVNEKVLPCITACPWESFKRRGFYFNSSKFMKETFDLEEVFILKGFGYDYTNGSLYSFDEIKSMYLGRCYMSCHLKPVKKRAQVFFAVRKERDINGESKIT